MKVWPGFWNLPGGDEVGAYMLFRCVVCHFEVQFDDVKIHATRGPNCVCVRCFHRETNSEKTLDKRSREEWERFVNAIEGTY